MPAQHRLPAAYYRGGTSKAVIFQPKHLPNDRSKWASIFAGVLGSPDKYGRQLDGMGGGVSSVSKVCVVGPPSRSDADVDYTFVAVGIKDKDVDFSANCGNMSSAIGPYAVDAKLFPVEADAKTATVRIHNTNTGKIIHSTFPLEDDEAAATGDFFIDGVSGTAARVQLDFIDPSGAKTGKLLPSGNVVDEIDGLSVTCVDVGNPNCFVKAADLQVGGGLSPDEIEQHPDLLRRLDSIRRRAAVKMGVADTPEQVPGSIPKIALVSNAGKDCDLRVRAISVGQPHRAVPITVALSTAAAANIPGSVVEQCTSDNRVDANGITIGHASGNIMVGAKFDEIGHLKYATVFRTARRLMEGTVFWKG